MTIVNFILILCAMIAIVWGAFTLWASLTKTKKLPTPTDSSTDESPKNDEFNEKNGIPIIPRHERPEYQTENEENLPEQLALPTQNLTPQPKDDEQTIVDIYRVQTQHDISEYIRLKPEDLSQDDAFSTLATATETITPTVQTFDERKLKKEGFHETSPILDTHIQTQLNNDQNSPLNNAIQNLNISLFPNEQFSRIAGRDLLNLFDKYGLKYGTMNMFHRYENKDGTGLLWFSVMMVTEEGILPFDLNKLPNQYVKGLVMFVALPHPEASRGFDSMISISGLLSQDLQASLYDEAGEPLTKENVQQMRELAINFAK